MPEKDLLTGIGIGLFLGAVITCVVLFIQHPYKRGVLECYTGKVTMELDSLTMQYQIKHLK